MANDVMQISVPSPSTQWISTRRLNEFCKAVAEEARPTSFSIIEPTARQKFQLTRLKLSKTTLYGYQHGCALHVVSNEPLDCFEVYIPAAGKLTARGGNVETTAKLGEGVIYFPGQRANNQWSDNPKALILRTKPSSLEPLIHHSFQLHLQQRQRGLWRFSLNHGLGRTLLGLLAQICTESYQSRDRVAATPVELENLLHYTLAYIVESLLAEQSDTDLPSELEPKYLRRVVDYILAHLDQDIGLGTLTEVSGVSARTLQNAFAKHFGKGPITFVKQAKLHQVREELQCSTPADTTVTEVAMKWGFYHASNFSRNYSDLFGELPIQTLRNPRSRFD